MYIFRYTSNVTEYSIAEARKHLSEIIDEAIEGKPARITRRGREVAVVVSAAEFERLRSGKKSFAETYAAYREEFPEGVDDDEGQLGAEFWNSLRDRAPGRDVEL